MKIKTWTLNKPFLKLSYGIFVIIALVILISQIIGITENPFYGFPALFYFLVSTIFIYLIALENTTSSFVLSFTLSTAFSQRFIVTYFYPKNLDFIDHLNFTHDELNYSMLFYTLCVISVFIGSHFANYLPKINFTDSNKTTSNKLEYITFFYFKLKTEKFLRIIILAYFFFLFLKFFIIGTTGIGLTGSIHTADQSLLHWFSSRSAVIGGYAFFSVILLKELNVKTRYYKYFFIFYFFENLLMASRSFFLTLIQNFTISFYILKKRIKLKYIVLALILLLLSSTLYYTAITILRNYLLSGEIYVSNESVFLSISRGFSQLEPLFLWVDMPTIFYSDSVGLFADIKLFINSFVIGDFIPDPNRVNLGKLMVQYGRQDDFDIFALAGHSENPGAFATTYMYLGLYGGMIYWLLLGIVLKILDRSDVHLFWQFSFVTSFAFGPTYTLYTTWASLITPMLLIGFSVFVFEFIQIIKKIFTKVF